MNPVPKSLKEEMVDMIEKIEPMKIENQIRNFLGEYKIHKHSISGIDGLKTRKLGTWLGVKNKFKLPLQVEGTGLTSGAWRGMTGEWVYYSDELIKKTAPLLAGAQIRVDHSDDGDALSTVVGWVTESKAIKTKKGKTAIHYKGLIFDPEMAKAVWQKKIRKTSVSPLVQEEIDKVKGLIAKDIKAFDEISILTGNNPACKDATIIAS